ncbi:Crp/Fnr family transcriptional regulator [Pararhodospirillum photometricum]|nr:cyclic nucleotide-binding domain-containing protein [Pararhodospirillum photometricum]
MDVELIEIQDFLARFPPFDLLPADVTADLARSIEIRYARKGTVLLAPGDQARFLCLVRAGAVETRDAEGELLARLGEGECFGVRSLLRGGTAYLHTTALEDTLLYQLPAVSFEALRRSHRHVEYYFGAQAGGSLAQAQEIGRVEGDVLGVPVATLLGRPDTSKNRVFGRFG